MMDVDETAPVTSHMLGKMRSFLNAFPLPPHQTPMGGNPLENVSDEALLSTPPHLIAHIQRTASQGGLQVVSPRQTPFSALMARKSGDVRVLGDHEVGSIADPTAEWPTIDGASLEMLLPDQPIAPYTTEISVRAKTKTRALTKGMEDLSDPVLTCLVKGRAVIDILKRDDVAGGAEEMTTLLAQAWGVTEAEIMELDGYNLGVEGELQRHAMKVDEVYPTLYAPVHIRSVISMGVSDLSKAVLLPGLAMDWRRLRVHAEAVFYLACMVEGLPIKKMRGYGTPGERFGPRDNMLIFAPAPGVAWSSAPETFAICPVITNPIVRRPSIPPEVRAALQLYAQKVRPVSALLAGGRKLDTWSSVAKEVEQLEAETLASSYDVVVRSMTTGSYRGRDAASAVRNAIFEIIEGAPINLRTRVVRFLTIATDEVEIHLGLSKVPDRVVADLAARFCSLGGFMREKIAMEARRRRTNLADWWEDILAQAPDAYAHLEENNLGWATVALWLAFREPTDRWRKLKSALNFRVLLAAAKDSVGAVPLPAKVGSAERLLHAARHGAKAISTAFAGYYFGVSDVAHAVAEVAEDMGKTRTAATLKEGAFLWTLRARALRAINVSLLAHDEPTASKNHLRVEAEPADIVLKPAPYMPYKSWINHVRKTTAIPNVKKKMIYDADAPSGTNIELTRKSSAFAKMDQPILACVNSKSTQYLNHPKKLAEDLERAWGDLAKDMLEVAQRFAMEVAVHPTRPRAKKKAFASSDVMEMVEQVAPKRARMEVESEGVSFWEAYQMDGADVALGIEDMVEALPDEIRDAIHEGTYRNPKEILAEVDRWKESVARGVAAQGETIR